MSFKTHIMREVAQMNLQLQENKKERGMEGKKAPYLQYFILVQYCYSIHTFLKNFTNHNGSVRIPQVQTFFQQQNAN